MANLYNTFETNTDKTKSQNTKKVDILFGLEAGKYIILDTEFDKNIVCVCGSCDLLLENNNQKETVTLNNYNVTIHLSKDVKTELKNYTKETKIVVEYLGENNG